MHLIFGGYAQGRLSYALKTYHKNTADVFDCAAQPLSEWNGQTILYHLEALVSQSLQQNKAPLTLLQEITSRKKDLASISHTEQDILSDWKITNLVMYHLLILTSSRLDSASQ